MFIAITILVAYLLGSIPFGWLIGRYWLGVDVCTKGSGNIGMTNVMRVGGRLPGVLTFLLDFSKGALAVAFGSIGLADSKDLHLWLSLTGAIVILGHVYPIFLGFRGGKGISTLFGTLAVLHFPTGIVAACVWGGVFAWKKISSLSALIMLVSLPILTVLVPFCLGTDVSVAFVGVYTLITFFLTYQHRENIKRLRQGAEDTLHTIQSNPSTRK